MIDKKYIRQLGGKNLENVASVVSRANIETKRIELK